MTGSLIAILLGLVLSAGSAGVTVLTTLAAGPTPLLTTPPTSPDVVNFHDLVRETRGGFTAAPTADPAGLACGPAATGVRCRSSD